MSNLTNDASISIQPIQPHQIESAKQLITVVCLEIWQGLLTESDLRQSDPMLDIEHVQSHYFDNAGTFLVLLEQGQVVGMGGIRRFDDEICELKRMWFLPAYRGKGWGRKMSQVLFNFARGQGYRKVRLDILNAECQTQALKLYDRLGFYPIERYNDSPCTLFLEKHLSSTELA
jgi:putative acetyltransferase